MNKQCTHEKDCEETTQELRSQINEAKKRAKEILDEEERREKEKEESERKIESERSKHAIFEETQSDEKTRIGSEVLKQLAVLKNDENFVEAVKLLANYDFDGEVRLYRRNSTDPAEALSNNRCDVLHEFGLYGNGRLFYANWEPPRSWAESMARGGMDVRAKRRQFLNKPEDFKKTSYRSLSEFNAFLQSEHLHEDLTLRIRDLTKAIKSGKAETHHEF